METWKHLRAILLLPGMLAVVIPGTILLLTGLDTLGLWQSSPAARVAIPQTGPAKVLHYSAQWAGRHLLISIGRSLALYLTTSGRQAD